MRSKERRKENKMDVSDSDSADLSDDTDTKRIKRRDKSEDREVKLPQKGAPPGILGKMKP
jgi:hypothetical protein